MTETRLNPKNYKYTKCVKPKPLLEENITNQKGSAFSQRERERDRLIDSKNDGEKEKDKII